MNLNVSKYIHNFIVDFNLLSSLDNLDRNSTAFRCCLPKYYSIFFFLMTIFLEDKGVCVCVCVCVWKGGVRSCTVNVFLQNSQAYHFCIDKDKYCIRNCIVMLVPA